MKNISKLLTTTFIKLLTPDNQEHNWPIANRKRRAVETQNNQVNEDNLKVDIEVNQEDLDEGLYLRCLVFYENEWNMDLCETSSITTIGDTATVNCNCQIDGYLAVGLVTTSNDLVYVEEIHTYEKQVKFTILDDFAKVSENKTEFLNAIKSQLIEFLQCKPIQIRELQTYPGSIIIEFLLTGSTQMEAEEMKEAYQKLVDFLESGSLTLNDHLGDPLQIPKQCIETCDEATILDPEDQTLLIIGMVLLAIVLMVIICIICGICAKKRQQRDKLKRLISPKSDEMTPSYRNIAFLENMDGTLDSLQKYRRNPTMVTSSPMMPLPAAYDVSFM